MSIVEIILNGSTFRHVVPKKVKVTSGTLLMDFEYNGKKQNVKITHDQTFDVYKELSDRYEVGVQGIQIGILVNGQEDHVPLYGWNNPMYVYKKDVTPIWGGKPLLAHIWQALRAFTARKAVSAL